MIKRWVSYCRNWQPKLGQLQALCQQIFNERLHQQEQAETYLGTTKMLTERVAALQSGGIVGLEGISAEIHQLTYDLQAIRSQIQQAPAIENEPEEMPLYRQYLYEAQYQLKKVAQRCAELQLYFHHLTELQGWCRRQLMRLERDYQELGQRLDNIIRAGLQLPALSERYAVRHDGLMRMVEEYQEPTPEFMELLHGGIETHDQAKAGVTIYKTEWAVINDQLQQYEINFARAVAQWDEVKIAVEAESAEIHALTDQGHTLDLSTEKVILAQDYLETIYDQVHSGDIQQMNEINHLSQACDDALQFSITYRLEFLRQRDAFKALRDHLIEEFRQTHANYKFVTQGLKKFNHPFPEAALKNSFSAAFADFQPSLQMGSTHFKQSELAFEYRHLRHAEGRLNQLSERLAPLVEQVNEYANLYQTVSVAHHRLHGVKAKLDHLAERQPLESWQLKYQTLCEMLPEFDTEKFQALPGQHYAMFLQRAYDLLKMMVDVYRDFERDALVYTELIEKRFGELTGHWHWIDARKDRLPPMAETFDLLKIESTQFRERYSVVSFQGEPAVLEQLAHELGAHLEAVKALAESAESAENGYKQALTKFEEKRDETLKMMHESLQKLGAVLNSPWKLLVDQKALDEILQEVSGHDKRFLKISRRPLESADKLTPELNTITEAIEDLAKKFQGQMDSTNENYDAIQLLDRDFRERFNFLELVQEGQNNRDYRKSISLCRDRARQLRQHAKRSKNFDQCKAYMEGVNEIIFYNFRDPALASNIEQRFEQTVLDAGPTHDYALREPEDYTLANLSRRISRLFRGPSAQLEV